MSLLTPHQSNALDYTKHISLTANAGSGKTFVLSKRYLEIAINQNLPLRNIAAITFTDKAASELYQKIANEIDSRIKTAEGKTSVEQLEMIRRQLVSANISTIHSFCIDILREHPVEAGTDANFTPIDEIFADEMIELSVEEVIKSSLAHPSDDEKLRYLIRLFSSKLILSKELTSSIRYRRNLLNLASKLYSLSDEAIANHFFKTFISLAEKLLLNSLEDFVKAVSKINSAVLSTSPKNLIAAEVKQILSQLEKEKDVQRILALLSNLKEKILVKAGTILIKGYLSREDGIFLEKECFLTEKYLDKLKYFQIPANHLEIELELAKFGQIFIHFFNKTLELYSEKKHEAGYLDYEDILLFTQNILQLEDVRKALSEKFKYIMIDEYQDTNELQYKIFLPILDNLKSGNLFVVGDEKQSIYMFRDAELEIFNKTKNEITERSGRESLQSLPDSFRMAPSICVFINTLFKNLFDEPNPLFNEVQHSDVVCARDDGISGNVELLLAQVPENEDEEIFEADLVTERILKLKLDKASNPEINWGDIAILCRKRKSFIELEKSFIRKKIPYSIIGGKGFYQRQSVYDIYNYFAFLLDQNDDTALVGILRSPFFSVSDSQIFEISLEQKSSFWQKLRCNGLRNPEVTPIVNILEENISLVNKVEISFLLRKIISETSYILLLSSKANAIQEQANIDKLISLTINFFADGFRTLYDYVNFLQEAIESVEDESQAVVSDELNSVKIMTIHQAKGLEFPIVFLYRCGEISRKTITKTKSILINKDFGLLTKVPLNEDYFGDYHAAPIVKLNDFIADRKNTAEIKRLFYVAITRAKNQLFLSSSLDSALSAKKDSFISLLQEGLNIDFNKDFFCLRSKLKLLAKRDDKYIALEKNLEMNIPIIKKRDSSSTTEIKDDKSVRCKSNLTQSIQDKVFGEIISATKLSVFNQCPLKYRLIYQLGFSNLMVQNRDWLKSQNEISPTKVYDFSSREDEKLLTDEGENKIFDSKYSRIKGTLIHRILSEDHFESGLAEKVENYLKDMLNKEEWDSNQSSELKKEIIYDLTNYLNSKSYEWIKWHPDSKNEFEIYQQHQDYYLYGIIDKLIVTENKMIIVDYKTDSIFLEEIQERANQYFSQLQFYAFIAGKLKRNTANVELRIIFIKHPNESVAKNLEPDDLTKIQQNIELMVSNVRVGNSSKNLEHCKFCIFSINGNCIIT
jgi:ATP-dependent helicase/nuclease subunit A